MRLSSSHARVLVSAWFALVLLSPLQAAAMGIGHQMTIACRMMPAIRVSGHGSQGGMRSMAACHTLQCHHRFGPRIARARFRAPPALAVSSWPPLVVSGPRYPTLHPPSARGPPLYRRYSHLLI